MARAAKHKTATIAPRGEKSVRMRSASGGPAIASRKQAVNTLNAALPSSADNATRAEFPEAFQGLFSPNRYKVYYGGRGGAKSWAVARALLIMGTQRPLRILCAREFQTTIGDSVKSLLDDQIALLGLRSFYKSTLSVIRGANGTEFKFTGLRINPDELKSFEGADICWVEEAQRVSEHSWIILDPTIRKPGSEIWITFNPCEDTDPMYRHFIVESMPDSLVAKVNYDSNPWFPDVLERQRLHMRDTDPDAYDWVWEGNCRKISDAVVFRGKFSIQTFETPSDVHLFFGADWGFGPDPTTLTRSFIQDRRLFVDYEAWAQGLELNQVPALFDSVPESRAWPIEADSSQPQTIKHVRSFGFNVRSAKKWPGSVEDGIAYLRSFDEIVVHERCFYTGQEMRLYSYKTDRVSGAVLPVLIDKHNHCIDSLRYGHGPRIGNSLGPIFSSEQAEALAHGI